MATWFGVGRIPVAPGTAGALAALPVAWLIHHCWGTLALVIATAVLFVLGTWAAAVYERHTEPDAGPIVVDEVVGQWIAVILVPADLVAYAIGFALFRIFDTIKPWPISLADRRIKGGFGVMFDDVLAGGWAAIILWHIWVWL